MAGCGRRDSAGRVAGVGGDRVSIDFTVMCQHPGCAGSEAPGVAWGGTLLCGLHVRGLQADVDDIARVLSLIEADASALHSPVGSDGTGGSTPGSRPPMRLAVLDVVTGQTAAAITGWAADVVRTSRALTVAQAARMLARNVDALMVHPAVGDVVVELRDAATSCRAAIPDDRWNSTEQDARPRTVGRCAEVAHDGGECGGSLVWITATLVVRCQRCHAEQSPDGWVHKRAVLRAFGLSRRTLNDWIAKGKVGGSESGLVCVDDVRSMVRCMRARRAADEGA